MSLFGCFGGKGEFWLVKIGQTWQQEDKPMKTLYDGNRRRKEPMSGLRKSAIVLCTFPLTYINTNGNTSDSNNCDARILSSHNVIIEG